MLPKAAFIFEKITNYHQEFDKEKIKQVLNFVSEKYADTEGDINYPLEILEILLPLRPDENVIAAVMLHDLYIMSFLNDEKVKQVFGQGVLGLLIALKRLADLNYGEHGKAYQIEVLRKMFLTLAKDLRVVVIWLAQRLHRMKNLHKMQEDGIAFKIAKETMDIYVPIASRLGIYRMKIQLEDLAFKYLNPNEYKTIAKQVENVNKTHQFVIEMITEKLKKFLTSKGIKAEIFGRVKSVYSIYLKLRRKGFTDIIDIYDFFAMRVILPDALDENANEIVDDLYALLGLIHSEWKPISSRFKDYVAVPKPNGYRSLHTVVVGLAPKDMDQPVEIQIRNESMHVESEYGIASHWIYKSQKGSSLQRLNYQIEWIRGLKKIHEFFGNESNVMKEVEVDIFKDRIFALTPRGEVKDLPLGANAIDFAYAVHTDIGNRCIAAKVNGTVSALDAELKNGDVVEIIIRKDATPKLRWLGIVKSSFAKHRIKSWFSSFNKDANLKEGKVLLNAQLQRLGKPILDQNYSIFKNFCGKKLNLQQRESLIEEVGKGGKLASDIIRKVYPYEYILPVNKVISAALPEIDVGKKMKDLVLEKQVLVGEVEGLPIKFAACCDPVIGDEIVAYITRGSSVTIHKAKCKLLDNLNLERIIFARWKGLNPSKVKYRVGIKLTVVSRIGLIRDITTIINDFGINIVDVMIKKAGSGLYYDCFLLDFDDLDKFDLMLDKFEGVNGVVKVAREDKFT